MRSTRASPDRLPQESLLLTQDTSLEVLGNRAHPRRGTPRSGRDPGAETPALRFPP